MYLLEVNWGLRIITDNKRVRHKQGTIYHSVKQHESDPENIWRVVTENMRNIMS
jgi:hypothetical protein